MKTKIIYTLIITTTISIFQINAMDGENQQQLTLYQAQKKAAEKNRRALTVAALIRPDLQTATNTYEEKKKEEYDAILDDHFYVTVSLDRENNTSQDDTPVINQSLQENTDPNMKIIYALGGGIGAMGILGYFIKIMMG